MSKIFCPLPWNHVAVKSDGFLRLCCASGNRGMYKDENNNEIGITQPNSIDKAINSSLAKEVRESILNEKWHPACIRCKTDEENGIKSRRINEVNNKQAQYNIDKPYVNFIDLKVGNICNLKCRMCGPSESTKWYNDYRDMGLTSFGDRTNTINMFKDGKKVYYNWHEKKEAWDNIKKQQLNEIYINGGESFLVKEHIDYLEHLTKNSQSEQITLLYSTNCTFVPKNLFDIWKKFKLVKLSLSVDSIYEMNEYIRYPSKWETIMDTLNTIDNYSGNNLIAWIRSTIQIYNIYYLPEIVNFWKVNNFRNYKIINRRYKPSYYALENPSHLNIKNMPIKVKHKIIDKFSKYQNDDVIRRYKKVLELNQNDVSLEYFLYYTRLLDKVRGQCFKDVFPEFHNIISGM